MKKLFLVIVLLPAVAGAWGDLGHQVVGEIAEQVVAKDAHTKNAIQEIIGVEPYALSATWPDHVRSDDRFADFAPYHFTTVFRDPHTHSEKDALTVIQRYPRVLVSPTATREEKMIAFRYLVHVVGDVHQPLHVGNEFDRGGNMCQVAWQPSPDKPAYFTNLHTVWDTSIPNEIAAKYRKLDPEVRYYGYKELARVLIKKYAQKTQSDATTHIEQWVRESAQLRQTDVYPDNLPEDARPYCQQERENIKRADIPVLGDSFAKSASQIAEKRMALAGQRLGAYLIEIFKKLPPRSGRSESSILDSLKLKNK